MCTQIKLHLKHNLSFTQMSKAIYAGNKGLANLGNTCYMNSALQCLSHLLTFHPLNEKFQAECEAAESESMIDAWLEFQREMWSNERQQMVVPRNLLERFQELCNAHDLYFENFEQNDVHEFLVLFLDLMHRGITRPVSFRISSKETNDVAIKAYDTWKRFYETDYSYIVHNFHSQKITLTSCPNCSYYTSNHEPEQVLTIEIPRGAHTIEKCLEYHTRKHILDKENLWTCDKCHKKSQAIQRTMLWKTPDILIIMLKRYSGRRKISRHIAFDETLDIKDYTVNYAFAGCNPSTAYALQAVSVQDGSLGGGHYYAYCKNNLDKQWRCYNDTNVTLTPIEKVLQCSGYVFFYKRV